MLRRFAATALSTVAISSCVAPPHPYKLYPGSEGATAVHNVALLPLNLASALPSGLEAPAARVSDRIDAYLKQLGKSVVRLSMYDSRRLWTNAIAQTKAANANSGFKDAARILALHLRGEHAFDALVMPNLVLREASVYHGTDSAAWDGVMRKIEVVGRPYDHGSIHVMTDIRGKMSGLSLHLFIFDSEGNRVFESIGGLDLVHVFDLSEWGKTQPRLKRNLLADEAALREGVRLAFTPYFTPPPAEAAPGNP